MINNFKDCYIQLDEIEVFITHTRALGSTNTENTHGRSFEHISLDIL